jgi:hypothetical protein
VPLFSVLRFAAKINRAFRINKKNQSSLEGYYVLEYDAVCSGRNLLSSGLTYLHRLRASNSEPSKLFTLMMKAVYFFF